MQQQPAAAIASPVDRGTLDARIVRLISNLMTSKYAITL
jgi:hypothetical protein